MNKPKFKVADTVVCARGVGITIFLVVKIFYVPSSNRKPTYFDALGIQYEEDSLELFKD